MEIQVADSKLRKAIEDRRFRQKSLGKEMANKLRIRVNSLIAAANLGVFWPPLSGPERCHELTGELAGVYSIDLKHPYRLLFESVDGLDKEACEHEMSRWSTITEVKLLRIENTHG